jgi:hypothetical protein
MDFISAPLKISDNALLDSVRHKFQGLSEGLEIILIWCVMFDTLVFSPKSTPCAGHFEKFSLEETPMVDLTLAHLLLKLGV